MAGQRGQPEIPRCRRTLAGVVGRRPDCRNQHAAQYVWLHHTARQHPGHIDVRHGVQELRRDGPRVQTGRARRCPWQAGSVGEGDTPEFHRRRHPPRGSRRPQGANRRATQEAQRRRPVRRRKQDSASGIPPLHRPDLRTPGPRRRRCHHQREPALAGGGLRD